MSKFKSNITTEALRDIVRDVLKESKVLGYIKPTKSFFTIKEWGDFVEKMLVLQKAGFDTRGGGKSLHPDIINLF